MLLRILAYDINDRYIHGRTQHHSDMISRSFLPVGDQETSSTFEVINDVQFLPMRQERIQNLQLETSKEETLQLLKATNYLFNWPPITIWEMNLVFMMGSCFRVNVSLCLKG